MDKIHGLAYLLFQSEDEKIRNTAIQIVCGDMTLKEAYSDSSILPYIRNAEKALRKQTLDKNEVIHFVEEFIYAT